MTKEKKVRPKKTQPKAKDSNTVATPKKSPKPKGVTKDIKKEKNEDRKKLQANTIKVLPNSYYGTGRRKSAIAKAWLVKGTGRVIVNGQVADDYLNSPRLSAQLTAPLRLTNLAAGFDVRVDIIGGGLSAQSDAAVLAISNAIVRSNESFRDQLRGASLLTQDAREKERKKYGKRGARKSPQYRKR